MNQNLERNELPYIPGGVQQITVIYGKTPWPKLSLKGMQHALEHSGQLKHMNVEIGIRDVTAEIVFTDGEVIKHSSTIISLMQRILLRFNPVPDHLREPLLKVFATRDLFDNPAVKRRIASVFINHKL